MNSTIAEIQRISIAALWQAYPPRDWPFNPELLTTVPVVARCSLECAITPGKPLASAIRLWLHGSIKLGEEWHSFRGEEVICWNRGPIWRATTWIQCLPIWVVDRIVDGVGEMQWAIAVLRWVIRVIVTNLTYTSVLSTPAHRRHRFPAIPYRCDLLRNGF